MQRSQSFLYGLVTLTAWCVLSCQTTHAQEEKREWRLGAEQALLGTWEKEKSSPESQAIPKFIISKVKSGLKIQFSGRDFLGSDSTDDLRLLARYEDANQEAPVVAFSLHKIGDDLLHVTLKLQNDVVLVEAVKIVSDTSEDIDRFFGATYTRTVKPSSAELAALDVAVAKTFDENSFNQAATDEAATDEAATNQQTAVKPAPKRGNIAGRIDTASTLRGKLTLSPHPKDVRPAEGLTVGSARPQFSFANVPEGQYTLTFLGTVDGVTRSLAWKGLKIDVAGGEKSLALKLR